MKKLVMSLLLSLALIAGMNSAYSLAQTEGLAQSGANTEQTCPNSGDSHHVKLEQKAKEMGITVDELKAKMKAEHQAKLEQKAKEMGITVDELKAKIKAKHEAN